MAQIDRWGQVIQGAENAGKLEQFAKMSQVPPIILHVSAENYSSETGSGSSTSPSMAPQARPISQPFPPSAHRHCPTGAAFPEHGSHRTFQEVAEDPQTVSIPGIIRDGQPCLPSPGPGSKSPSPSVLPLAKALGRLWGLGQWLLS